jgi:long-chain fatty acid transport protein
MVRGGLGLDIGWGVRLGIGVSALAEIDGSVVVATDATGKVGSSVQDQLIAVYAPELGASWDLPLGEAHTWRVGATYRGALDARFAVEIDATKLSSLALPVFNIAGVAQYDPAEVVVEAAHETREWVVAAGFTFKRWSQYPGPIEPTILCPAAQPGCGALTPASIPFSNTVVPRLGAERRFHVAPTATVAARAGFFYEPTPVPSSLPSSQAFDDVMQATGNVPTRFFDASKYVFSIGGGVAMAKPLPPVTLDAWAQLQLLASHDVQIPPAGAASLSGHVLATGLLAGVKF